MSRERYLATECLFNPNLIDVDQPGMSRALFDCIEGCEVDLRKPLREHIVLSGGTTMYPGLPSRYVFFDYKTIRLIILDLRRI